MHDGNKGNIKKISFCAKTIPVKLAVCAKNKTGIKIKPKETS